MTSLASLAAQTDLLSEELSRLASLLALHSTHSSSRRLSSDSQIPGIVLSFDVWLEL